MSYKNTAERTFAHAHTRTHAHTDRQIRKPVFRNLLVAMPAVLERNAAENPPKPFLRCSPIRHRKPNSLMAEAFTPSPSLCPTTATPGSRFPPPFNYFSPTLRYRPDPAAEQRARPTLTGPRGREQHARADTDKQKTQEQTPLPLLPFTGTQPRSSFSAAAERRRKAPANDASSVSLI